MSTILRAGAAAVLAAALAGCAGAASPPPTAAPTTAATVAPTTAASSEAPAASSAAPAESAAAGSGDAVTIANFAFAPPTLTVKTGTTVTWTNNDSIGHTVTFDDNSGGSGTLNQGATFKQTFSKAGTFAYHCKIHPSMTATVTVTG